MHNMMHNCIAHDCVSILPVIDVRVILCLLQTDAHNQRHACYCRTEDINSKKADCFQNIDKHRSEKNARHQNINVFQNKNKKQKMHKKERNKIKIDRINLR